MKKLFALMLALCLLCGCTALADTNLSWEEVEPFVQERGITGDWYTFEQIAVAIMIPSGFEAQELPSDAYIGYFAAANNSAVGLMYVDVDGMDLQAYAEYLKNPEIGATEIEFGTLNGLPCVSYEVPANKTLNVAFTTEAGYILEAFCGPVNDDEDKTIGSYILASIQAYSAEE